jgi:hypothetical protein
MRRSGPLLGGVLQRIKRLLAPPVRITVSVFDSPAVVVLTVRGRLDARATLPDLPTFLWREGVPGEGIEALLDLTRVKLANPVAFSDFLVHAYNRLPKGPAQRLKIITGRKGLQDRLPAWFSIEGAETLFEPFDDLSQALAACQTPRTWHALQSAILKETLKAASNGAKS